MTVTALGSTTAEVTPSTGEEEEAGGGPGSPELPGEHERTVTGWRSSWWWVGGVLLAAGLAVLIAARHRS
jgi:hypothetical protein